MLNLKNQWGLRTLYYKYDMPVQTIYLLVPIALLILIQKIKVETNIDSSAYLSYLTFVTLFILAYRLTKWIKIIINMLLVVKTPENSRILSDFHGLRYISYLTKVETRLIVREYTKTEIGNKLVLFEIDDYTTGKTIYFMTDTEDALKLNNVLEKQIAVN